MVSFFSFDLQLNSVALCNGDCGPYPTQVALPLSSRERCY
jgi:hypothetical protein